MTKPATEPKMIGSYQIVRELGRGSFGTTYLATKRKPEGDQAPVEVALKILRSDAAVDGRLRFTNECWALEQVRHASLPSLLDKGEHDDLPFFVMTLARGESLRKKLAGLRHENGVFSELVALRILIAVLEAVGALHRKSILHRDIKDDNVIATLSADHVTLIDLGYCKGNGQPVNADSFNNVGAPRYSPPAKLENPSIAVPSHDVFAVGVLAYLLLTGEYPWSASASEDRGVLRRLMETQPAVDPTLRNQRLSRETNDLILSLIQTSDLHRPNVEVALESAKAVRALLEERYRQTPSIPTVAIRYEWVVRDPVHGDIRLHADEKSVIATREFQRLRQLRQLGLANRVYPGAEHTRFMHSLGTVFVAERILKSIEDITGNRFDPEERLTARLFALVHDITHIPFGHTLEDELAVFPRHDENNDRIDRFFFSPKSELGAVLELSAPGRAVKALLDPNSTTAKHAYSRQLVGGPAGADVIDYIDRDSYFCGLDHSVDSAVYRRFTFVSYPGQVSEKNLVPRVFGHHGIRLDAEFALESILLERFALFLKVYAHPAKAVASAMLGRAVYEECHGKRDHALTEEQIEWMGDDELLLRLRASRKSLVKELASRILSRRFYSMVYQASLLDSNDLSNDAYVARLANLKERKLFTAKERIELENKLAKQAGLKHGEVIIYFAAKAPGYRSLEYLVSEEPGAMKPRDETHKAYRRIRERHLTLWSAIVATSAAADSTEAKRVAEHAEHLIGRPNRMPMTGIQRLIESF